MLSIAEEPLDAADLEGLRMPLALNFAVIGWVDELLAFARTPT
jgi:hypothetical protein